MKIRNIEKWTEEYYPHIEKIPLNKIWSGVMKYMKNIWIPKGNFIRLIQLINLLYEIRKTNTRSFR